MAEAIVSMVIRGFSPVGSLMFQEAKFLNGVGDQVELAQSELLLMQGFLKDADARQENEEVVRLWVGIIREAAYDLDDAIQSFVLKLALKREASMWVVLKRYTCFLSKGVDRYKTGLEIESITTKLSKLRLTMQGYDIKQEKGNGEATSSMRQRRLTYPHILEHDVVGLQNDIEMLATHLVEDKCHRVVSIWGMGGSGKTTLAKQIYNHKKVKYYFDCFAWVCISQQCDGTTVMKEVFMKVSGMSDEQRQGIANLSNDEIAERLCNFQRQRKCLVVLDDIWTLASWNSIKGGFTVNEETESRILLTSRNREVASFARGNTFLYGSRALSADESWNLFQKIAFSENNDTISQIISKKEELGRIMLQHCAGLPLAIVVLAGLLARKETVDEWETVHKNADVYIRRGADLEREYKGQKYEGASWVLALSYDNLPYRLKPCFLYLGNFPEDYEIPVKRLCQLWMGEGFISTTSTEMMDDASYSCLSELVERCMVQVADIGLYGKVKTCRLHDLMRDLCLLKAEEENFFQIVNLSGKMRFKQAAPIAKVRRLVIYMDRVNTLAPTSDAHLRSLLYFSPKYFFRRFRRKDIQPLFKNFRLLRVLKFEGMLESIELPSAVGNLVHLRFLSVKDSGVRRLPSSVANLMCMQTLDLRSNGGMTVSNVFKNMQQLRHLYLPPGYSARGEKLSFATLCNLQSLVNVDGAECDLSYLVELSNLIKLDIYAVNPVNWSKHLEKPKVSSEDPSPLENLAEMLKSRSITYTNLRSLSLFAEHSRGLGDLILRFPFIYKLRLFRLNRLPEELLCYPNLVKIKLCGTRLEEDQIEILEKLPKLRVLYLEYGAFASLSSNTLVCSSGGFPNLEFLTIYSLKNFEEWTMGVGCMRRLCKLNIEDCEGLRAIPDGLQNIATLKELVIKRMRVEFCSRLDEGGEDFYKIKHVASVIITNRQYIGEVNDEILGRFTITSTV